MTVRELQHRCGRTGLQIVNLETGGRLVASGPKAVTSEAPGRRWRVRREDSRGVVVEQHEVTNWQSAGRLMHQLGQQYGQPVAS